MSTGELSQQEIDALLNRAAERARRASEAHRAAPSTGVGLGDKVPTRVPAAPSGSAERGVFDELLDIPLDVRIRLGEAEMTIEEVVSLRDGSVVELDRAPGDPVDILVNDRVVARGEIVVVDDRFTVRVTEMAAGARADTGEAEQA
jgi:flagellar motor switch protein FliN/FliY